MRSLVPDLPSRSTYLACHRLASQSLIDREQLGLAHLGPASSQKSGHPRSRIGSGIGLSADPRNLQSWWKCQKVSVVTEMKERAASSLSQLASALRGCFIIPIE